MGVLLPKSDAEVRVSYAAFVLGRKCPGARGRRSLK